MVNRKNCFGFSTIFIITFIVIINATKYLDKKIARLCIEQQFSQVLIQ